MRILKRLIALTLFMITGVLFVPAGLIAIFRWLLFGSSTQYFADWYILHVWDKIPFIDEMFNDTEI